MTDYATLNGRLTGRCHARRKVANNTYAERRGDAIAIKLHDTDVVTLHPDGSITLNTGGWHTVTTKDRLNSYLPYGVWDADFCELGDKCPGEYEPIGDGKLHFHGTHHGPHGKVWSVKGEWFVHWFGKDYPYRDGIRLFPDGTVTGAPDERKLDEDRKVVAYRRKLIKEYLAALTPEQIVYACEHMGGDPWCCSMRAEDGTRPMSSDCVLEHVRRKHTHASLFFWAVEASHYRTDVYMSMFYGDAQRGKVSDQLIRMLRKFFTKQLIEGRATR